MSTVVAPVIQHLSTSGNVEILYGIDYASFNALKPFVFLAGGPFKGPNDVIIDDVSQAQSRTAYVWATRSRSWTNRSASRASSSRARAGAS